MNHIGAVVRELRESAGMSRKELCEGICTEKYAYLIERCERTPSAEILRLLSVRLGYNLFDYFEYLDCADPVGVCATIARLDLYRYNSRYEALRGEIDRACAMPDFSCVPWSYELEMNRAHYMVLGLEQYREGALRIEELLADVHPRHASGVFVSELYTLLIVCRLFLGDRNGAEAALAECERLPARGKGAFRDTNLHVTLGVNRITLHLSFRRFEEAADEALRLYRFQIENAHVFRVHLTCFLLALSYMKLGNLRDALLWFRKGMYLALFERMGSMDMLARFPEFWQLLRSDEVPTALAEELIAMYGLAPAPRNPLA